MLFDEPVLHFMELWLKHSKSLPVQTGCLLPPTRVVLEHPVLGLLFFFFLDISDSGWGSEKEIKEAKDLTQHSYSSPHSLSGSFTNKILCSLEVVGRVMCGMWNCSCSDTPGGFYRETEPSTEFCCLLFIQPFLLIRLPYIFSSFWRTKSW